MRSVIMDRWGIDSAIEHLGGNLSEEGLYYHAPLHHHAHGDVYSKRFADLCWENFLTAIVLWDEIWSLNPAPYDWERLFEKKTSMVQDNLERIVHRVDSSMVDDKLLTDYYLLTGYGSQADKHWMGPNREADELAYMMHRASPFGRASSYQAISRCLGVPYLAHPLRTNRIADDYYFRKKFDRRDVLERIDKELSEYYDLIDDELGRDLYKYQFHYPVIVDLIKKGTSTPEEELLSALELREEPDVCDFRDAINSIEQAVQNGNTQVIFGELEFVSDLAKKITMKYKERGATLGKIVVSIPLSVSIDVPIRLWWRDPRRKYKPQATFIRRLINYGVNERPLDR